MQVLVRKVSPAGLGIDDPLLDRIYSARGVLDPAELDLKLNTLLSPEALPDITKAADRLADALEAKERILIVGDFDADGATSVALCMLALKSFGFENLDFLVPNRFDFGYGLSPEIVQLAQSRHPDLILTVDNGVASNTGVDAANASGIDVIVTDHHLPGEVLPKALALVNPNLSGSNFASKSMAGVGVAYYLLSRLRQVLRSRNWFAGVQREEPNLAQYLDLVALGTVADVVPLDRNNRVLVHNGLLRMRRGFVRPGIRALAAVAKRDLSRLSVEDIGFGIAPRLNAAGRLEDISVGIRCLMTEDEREASHLAASLDVLNETRRHLQQDMVVDAELIVSQFEATEQTTGLSVYHESFHQGVVGIVAGRLREKFHRPAVVFADAGALTPSELKGSARSIDGVNVRDVLDSIATKYPGLLIKFGGHAMAAGLSIKKVHLQRFHKVFDKAVASVVTQDMLSESLVTDGALASGDLTLGTAERLEAGGPWGSGFAKPLFTGEFVLVSQRVVGGTHLKLVVKLADQVIDAIAFSQPVLSSNPTNVLLVYKLSVNDYGGVRTLQLMVEYVEALP
jgi:single-stranded-DNA-specific exonuclease